MTSIGRRVRIDWLGSEEGCLREDGLNLMKEFWRYWGCYAAAPTRDNNINWNWVGECGKGGVSILEQGPKVQLSSGPDE